MKRKNTKIEIKGKMRKNKNLLKIKEKIKELTD